MTWSVFRKAVLLAGAGYLAAGPAMALEVSRSALVNHPVEEVWALIGNFDSLDTWHPAVVKLEASGDGGVGSYRTLTLPDGGTLKEKLLENSQEDMSYSYSIESGVLPVANYTSTLSVRPAAHLPGQSIVLWSSRFDPVGIDGNAARNLIGGIYQAGFESIAETMK
jgi:mxaD protein